MKQYVVAYDLKGPDRDYRPIHRAIEAYEEVRRQGSVWTLRSDTTAQEILDDLATCVEATDDLLVAEVLDVRVQPVLSPADHGGHAGLG